MILRIAGILAVLQGLAHGTLVLRARPTHGDEEIQVVAAMKQHAFNFAGTMHSYWDFYFGYAMIAAAICVVEGIFLWLLEPLYRDNPDRTRPLVWLVLLANLGHAALIVRFFFLVPLVPDALVALTLAAALWRRPMAAGATAS